MSLSGDYFLNSKKGYEIWARAPVYADFDIYGDEIKYNEERVELIFQKLKELAGQLDLPRMTRTERYKHLEIECNVGSVGIEEFLCRVAQVLDEIDFSRKIERVTEAILRSAILVYLYDYKGEVVSVDELFEELITAGFMKSYVNQLLSDLFLEKKGILLTGVPLGSAVMMYEDFEPEGVYVTAHKQVYEEALRSQAKIMPTYHRLVTESID